MIAFVALSMACSSPQGPDDDSGPQRPRGGGSGTSGPPAPGTADVPFSCTGGVGPGPTVGVPEGGFIMGCNEAVDATCAADEFPMRNIFVSGFEIDVTEVTQEQYTACVEQGACSPPSCGWDCAATTFPATCINRPQAMNYCNWAGGRLPTEAEWEKAARGPDGLKYPWGNAEPDCNLANMMGCGGIAPVGSRPAGASPYGALDMSGNVVEMLGDWYDPGFYQAMPEADPQGPASGDKFVGRGGGFNSDVFWQRASVRDWYTDTDAKAALGFRCVR